MSSYWAGYYGVALVLTDEEFDDFCEKYKSIKLIDDDTFNDALNENGVRDYNFIKSDKNGVFDIIDVCTEDCDGMCLIPYFHEGKENKHHANTALRLNSCYVVFSDKSMDSLSAFTKRPYESYEDLVQEFKNKLECYLPEDFNWDEHIGRFSYAAYA